MLNKLSTKNLSVFPSADFNFASGLNVIIGENGCGKSHVLKVVYSIIAASAEEGRKPNAGEPTKVYFSKTLASKLIHVLRPESIGRLARRKQGRERCEIALEFTDPELNCQFDFATSAKSDVQISSLPKTWQAKSPVFIPTRELLSIYPSFVSVYDNHYLEFDETYRDLCVLLGAPALKGAREKKIAMLLKPIEEAMGGKVVLDSNGRFYLKLPGSGNMEMPLVAEGLRKLAMVARLIATGALLDNGYLFWDEPETNLNPRLIKLVANVIFHICQNGIQVFIATHSLFLLRELEVLSSNKVYKNIKQCYFALNPTHEGVKVSQANTIDGIDPIVMLDEELHQSDRYMDGE